MAYESRYYVVAKSRSEIGMEGNKCWAQKIAEFNMSKFDALADFFKDETDCFVYADDGNTPILTDKYGDPLKELSIDATIAALSEVEGEFGCYRRVAPFKALITAFKDDAKNWDEDLVVLHYGY